MPYSALLEKEITDGDWQRLRGQSLRDFELSGRAASAASQARCRRLSRLAQKGERYWYKQPGVGPGTVKEFRKLLSGVLAGRIKPMAPLREPRNRGGARILQAYPHPSVDIDGEIEEKLDILIERLQSDEFLDAVADRVTSQLFSKIEKAFRLAEDGNPAPKRTGRPRRRRAHAQEVGATVDVSASRGAENGIAGETEGEVFEEIKI